MNIGRSPVTAEARQLDIVELTRRVQRMCEEVALELVPEWRSHEHDGCRLRFD